MNDFSERSVQFALSNMKSMIYELDKFHIKNLHSSPILSYIKFNK